MFSSTFDNYNFLTIYAVNVILVSSFAVQHFTVVKCLRNRRKSVDFIAV